jgi:hypothetical protein
LVANGHHWSSIKTYTLSEIGSFFNVVVIQDRNRKAQNIVDLWQGNNLTLEGVMEILDSVSSSSSDKKKIVEPSREEIDKDWSRLASFMSKHR